MPSKTQAQHNLMAMVANDPKAAKRVGVPQSVGREFVQADKGKKFGGTKSRADVQAINKPLTNHGKSAFFSKGGSMAESKKMMQKEVAFMKAKGAPKAMVKHEQAEMKGMKKGGMPRYAAGGMVAPTKMGKVTAGGMRAHGEHTVQQKGHTKAKQVKMNRGGMC